MILIFAFTVLTSIYISECKKCEIICPDEGDTICTFDVHNKIYKMFPNECAMSGYAQCHQVEGQMSTASDYRRPWSLERQILKKNLEKLPAKPIACDIGYFVKTPVRFCIKEHFTNARRMYGESCPVFCPSHYSPVCGASKYRSYNYRTFNNGCYLDMVNCRGDDDYTGYVEVPLSFCQRHLMKNIFKEKLVISNAYDYRDYN